LKKTVNQTGQSRQRLNSNQSINITKKFKSLAVLLLLIFYQSNAQSSMTLHPHGNMGEDVMIWDLVPDSNMATWPQFKADAYTWNGTPGLERSLLDFNLNLLPPNSTIIHADLSLYVDSTEAHSTLSGSNECRIQRITSLWNPAAVTWNTQPSTDSINEVLIPPSTGIYDDYLNIDVTALIQDLYNNPGVFQGLMIKLSTEIHYRRMVFESTDQPDTTRFPALTINYSTVGINEIQAPDALSIFPSPSTGKFFIALEKTINNGYVEIINTLGECVFRENIFNESKREINLKPACAPGRDISGGIYFVKVFDGEKDCNKKIIIEHD